jgi:hypothetical protein
MEEELIELWPAPLVKITCDIDYQDEADAMMQEPQISNNESGTDRISVNNMILDGDKYPKLYHWILEQANSYGRRYLSINKPLWFTQSCVNQMEGCNVLWTRPHVHKSSFVTGVFYFQKTEGDGDLHMWRPKSIVNMAEMPVPRDQDDADANKYTTNSIPISGRSGQLLLWPGYLPHSIDNFKTNNTRAALAFDMITDLTLHVKPTNLTVYPVVDNKNDDVAATVGGKWVVLQNR